ncbi:hypothetical protein ACIQXV_03970 [Neobacillus sp. NPDC097160]|uniref:hypothetical protein n=1 Tax=Neobacillus sp. NPDC097160 TaxID=3364298 RepID=UPI0038136DF8
MKIVIIVVLLAITAYTMGFGISLWKEKQKFGAVAFFFSFACHTCSSVLFYFEILIGKRQT